MKKGKKNLQCAFDQFKNDQATDLKMVRGGMSPEGANRKSHYLSRTAEYWKYTGPPIGFDSNLEED